MKTPAITLLVVLALTSAAISRADDKELAQALNDASEDLSKELSDLTKRGAIAFGSVMLVLAVTLRRWRAVALVMGSTAVAISATAL